MKYDLLISPVTANRTSSPYLRARSRMVWLLVSMVAIVWGVPLVLTAFGVSSDRIITVVLPLAIAWFLVGAVGSFLTMCPTCYRSLFQRSWGIGVFWPAKKCSKCGRDLTSDRPETP